MKAVEELVKLYQEAQKKLVQIITRKARAGSLAQYERRILKQITAELKELKKASPDLVRKMVLEGCKTGLDSAVQDILSSGVAQKPTYDLFSRINRRQIDLIVQNIVDSLTKAVNLVGRRIEDELREAGLRAASLKTASGSTVKEMQKDLQTRLLGLDLKQSDGRIGVKYSNNTVVSIDTYAKMVSRTTPAEAQNKAKIIQAAQWGYDLVRCTTHSPTCAICAQYQDRIYALTREAANGKYRGPNGEQLRFPLLYETALVDGYETIHPNCRHRFVIIVARAYTPAELAEMSRRSTRPFEDTRTDAERKAYAAEQAVNRKRNADLREWQRYRAALPKQAPATFAGFRRMKSTDSQRYRDLKSDYRYLIDKSRNDGILKDMELKPIPITDEAIARIPAVQFQALNKEQSKTVQELHRALLEFVRKEPPDTEAIAYYDLDLNLLSRYTGGQNQVSATSYNVPHIIMHNHPDGLLFTHEDVARFISNGDTQIMSAVGNSGSLYVLEKTEEYNAAGFIRYLQEMGLSHPNRNASPEKYIQFMEDLLKGVNEYGINYVGRA